MRGRSVQDKDIAEQIIDGKGVKALSEVLASGDAQAQWPAVMAIKSVAEPSQPAAAVAGFCAGRSPRAADGRRHALSPHSRGA